MKRKNHEVEVKDKTDIKNETPVSSRDEYPSVSTGRLIVQLVVQIVFFRVFPLLDPTNDQLASYRYTMYFPYFLVALVLLYGCAYTIVHDLQQKPSPSWLMGMCMLASVVTSIGIALNYPDPGQFNWTTFAISVWTPLLAVGAFWQIAKSPYSRRLRPLIRIASFSLIIVVASLVGQELSGTSLGQWISAWTVSLLIALF